MVIHKSQLNTEEKNWKICGVDKTFYDIYKYKRFQ